MKLLRLQRILHLIKILQSGRFCNPNDLAKELKVTRRTIFRDLETLRKAGIPYFHDDHEGGYKIGENFLLPPLNFDLQESIALLLVLTKNINHSFTLPLSQQIQQAALKIEGTLPGRIQKYCGSILKNTSVRNFDPASTKGTKQNFTLLQQAIRKTSKVQIKYDSFYEKQHITTTLSPYHLHFALRGWYIIGYSSLHQQDRIFKVNRIRDLKILDKRYLQEKPFNIDDFLGKAWTLIPDGKVYNVKLLFSPMVARNVAEVLWHPTQKISWHENGKLIFEAEVDGLKEICWWILGYGDQVEVVTPAPLRQKIKQLAQKTLDIYK